MTSAIDSVASRERASVPPSLPRNEPSHRRKPWHGWTKVGEKVGAVGGQRFKVLRISPPTSRSSSPRQEVDNGVREMTEMYRDPRRYSFERIFPADEEYPYANFGVWCPEEVGMVISRLTRQSASAKLYGLVVEQLKKIRGEVLEIGCGWGGGSMQIARALKGYGATVVAMDLVPEQVRRSKAALRGLGSLRGLVRAELGNATDMPHDDNSFVQIVALEMLQHVADLRAFVSECARVSKPGGRLVVATFFGVGENAQEAAQETVGTVKQGIDHIHPVGEFVALLKGNGFTHIEMDHIGDRVFEGFTAWMEQGKPGSPFNQSWKELYERGLIDYILISADFAGKFPKGVEKA